MIVEKEKEKKKSRRKKREKLISRTACLELMRTATADLVA
jgi:hypothetical protein